jgi:catechol-2,3-dioxygenase
MMGMKSMIRAKMLHHAVLNVTDIHASVAFYEKILGLKVVAWNDAKTLVFLSFGGKHHDLSLNQRAQGPVSEEEHAGLNHLGWQLDSWEDLQAAYEELLELGVNVDRTTQHNITNSVYVTDPDGIMVELFCDRFEDGYSVMKNQGPRADPFDIRKGELIPN